MEILRQEPAWVFNWFFERELQILLYVQYVFLQSLFLVHNHFLQVLIPFFCVSKENGLHLFPSWIYDVTCSNVLWLCVTVMSFGKGTYPVILINATINFRFENVKMTGKLFHFYEHFFLWAIRVSNGPRKYFVVTLIDIVGSQNYMMNLTIRMSKLHYLMLDPNRNHPVKEESFADRTSNENYTKFRLSYLYSWMSLKVK